MNPFTCAMCGKTAERTVSEEEAQAEYEAVFGEDAVADKSVVCDDCYRQVVPDGKPIAELLRAPDERPDTLGP